MEGSAPLGTPTRNSRDLIELMKQATGSTPFLACVLAALTWPYSKGSLLPATGLDSSWQGSLARAAASGLHFGTQAVFTYGPLGFLSIPNLYETGTALAAFAYGLALSVAIFWLLLRALRPVVPLPVALVLAYVAGASVRLTATEPDVAVAFTLVAVVGILSGERADGGRIEWVVLGMLLGTFSIVEVSAGAGVLAMSVVALAFLPSGRVRALRVFVPAVLLTFAVGWFATGNGLGNLVPYIVHSIPIVSGYSAAMSMGAVGLSWQPWLILVGVAIVAVVAWSHCRGLSRRRQVGIALATAFVLWFLAKEALVRETLAHLNIFFAFLPILVVAFRPSGRSWTWLTSGLIGTVVLVYVVGGTIPTYAYRPDLSVRHLGGEALTLASGSQRHSIMAQARAEMQATYAVPSAMLARMRGHTVDVNPWEQNVTWAYPGSTFDPLPVFQLYSAYTSSLDRLNASFLATAQAPSLILKEYPVAIDGEAPVFDAPLTEVEMECRYRQVAVNDAWQLVAKEKDRCGPLRRLSTARTTRGGDVRVPAARPGDAIVATFDIPSSISWRLEGLFFKPPEVCMDTVQVGGANVTYRFIVGTATDIHLLRAASTLGYSSPFVPPTIDSLQLSVCGARSNISGVKVSFYEIAMHPSP